MLQQGTREQGERRGTEPAALPGSVHFISLSSESGRFSHGGDRGDAVHAQPRVCEPREAIYATAAAQPPETSPAVR